MGEGGYLGLDESNHGRYPEVFVAVYSRYPQDIIYREKPMLKRRKKPSHLPQLGDREFRHILILREHRDILGTEGNVRVMVLAEFIKNFKGLELVIVDGDPNSHEIESLHKVIAPSECPQILYTTRADVTYPIVNQADSVANHLFRYYKKSTREKKKYLKKLITPRIEDYCTLLEP